MGYQLYDKNGKFLGDVATAKGLNQLYDLHLPALSQLLESGTADAEEVAAIVKEIEDVSEARSVHVALLGCTPPVILTDGVSDQ